MAAMSHWTLGWLAPVAFVGAVGLGACGGDDAGETTRTGGTEVTTDAGYPNPWEAGNRAAERALRAAG